MKIVEKVRSAQDPAVAPTRLIRRTPLAFETESELNMLTRQLRRATARNHAEFDRGFQAAILMLEHGADLERLKEASGVVAGEWEDTQPVACDIAAHGWDQEDTLVEQPEFALCPEAG